MFRFAKLSGLAILSAIAAGCATTSFVSSWQVPVDGPIELDNKRVAAGW